MVFNDSFLYLVKHYAFLVDGTAESSVKSFLEGNRGLEEFQKVNIIKRQSKYSVVLVEVMFVGN